MHSNPTRPRTSTNVHSNATNRSTASNAAEPTCTVTPEASTRTRHHPRRNSTSSRRERHEGQPKARRQGKGRLKYRPHAPWRQGRERQGRRSAERSRTSHPSETIRQAYLPVEQATREDECERKTTAAKRQNMLTNLKNKDRGLPIRVSLERLHSQWDMSHRCPQLQPQRGLAHPRRQSWRRTKPAQFN